MQTAPDLSQYLSLGPSVSYTTDLPTAQSNLATLQAYAAANPSDTNAQQALQEQQAVITYLQGQGALNSDTTQSSDLGNTINAINAQNWGAIGPSQFDSLNSLANQYGMGGNTVNIDAGNGNTIPMKLSDALSYISKYYNSGGGSGFWNVMRAVQGVLPSLQSAVQSGVGTAQGTLATDLQKMIQGYTLPSVNTQGALSAESNYLYGPTGQPVTSQNEGVVNATLDPMVADAYRTRYVTNQASDAKMNQMGALDSGANQNVKNKENNQIFNTLGNESSGVYNKAAGQMAGLANTLGGFQQGQQAVIKNTQQAQTGQEFTNAANTNMNDWLSNFNTGVGQNIATMQNNFAQDLANQSQNSNILSSAGNILAGALSGV